MEQIYSTNASADQEPARVSIKIEVASGLDRVTECISKGPLVPFPRGGGGGGEGLSAFRPTNF